MLGYRHRFIRSSRPCQRSFLQPFVQEQKSVAFPQESLDPVTAPAAEQEQYIPFKRVHLITAFDDLRQSGDPFSKISIAYLSLCEDNAVYPHRIIILIFSKTVYFAHLSKEKMRITY